ncbi:hypothetical protein VVD49_11840 [Uliginosibacterium sp. H3]|uniref:Uncharacterized protein n=1 Tax=Uliginosibacterium silvisoli TaxID=3114758 RepID=A0ABU6K3E7_9RHOO|nr:hypothetical protein [Uliginosibacterium sp. H3]
MSTPTFPEVMEACRAAAKNARHVRTVMADKELWITVDGGRFTPFLARFHATQEEKAEALLDACLLRDHAVIIEQISNDVLSELLKKASDNAKK